MTPACLQGQRFLLLQRVRQVQSLTLVGGACSLVGGGGRPLVGGRFCSLAGGGRPLAGGGCCSLVGGGGCLVAGGGGCSLVVS